MQGDHIMIDLETLDTASTAVVLSIGAVSFNASGVKQEFYRVVDIDSCLKAGLTISGSTFKWWLTKDESARKALADTNGLDLYRALTDLREEFNWDDTLVWGNGADFDLSILANAYAAYDEREPWAYYNTRCYRTLKNMTPKEQYNALKVSPAMAHHALADARAQAQTAVKLLWP